MAYYAMNTEEARNQLIQCLDYNNTDVINRITIDNVLASVASDSDLYRWYWVVTIMGDGSMNYAIISATRCDVCGWPHSEMTVSIVYNIDNVVSHVNGLHSTVRQIILSQLASIQPQYDKDADGI